MCCVPIATTTTASYTGGSIRSRGARHESNGRRYSAVPRRSAEVAEEARASRLDDHNLGRGEYRQRRGGAVRLRLRDARGEDDLLHRRRERHASEGQREARDTAP